jgi:hypothetical protein
VRKRGRPKGSKNKPESIPEPKSMPEVPQVEAYVGKDGVFEKETPGAECRYCSRFIPRQALEIHERNCRAAAVGYATEVHET